jgi:hypothetical protein
MIEDRKPTGMKVYVLTDGAYSDYYIAAVFSSLEALESAVKARGDSLSDYNDPEVFEVDEWGGFQDLPAHEVTISIPTGEILGVYTSAPYWRHPDRCESRIYESAPHGRCIVVVSPVSVEHAIKVAVEKRQEYLRSAANL